MLCNNLKQFTNIAFFFDKNSEYSCIVDKFSKKNIALRKLIPLTLFTPFNLCTIVGFVLD